MDTGQSRKSDRYDECSGHVIFPLSYRDRRDSRVLTDDVTLIMIEYKFYWPDFRCRRKLTVH